MIPQSWVALEKLRKRNKAAGLLPAKKGKLDESYQVPGYHGMRHRVCCVGQRRHAESCCEKAKAAGKTCEHACCVKAAKDAKTCEKCNPKKEAK